ncbi:hypothetical protein [Cellvibrio sp. QJXJ]|uniref:hypothetical protein n=1 Tax=Cellvibrio sp. QJXJ TaxID=2964606 RepID=UPI0021C3CC90|nr:hypothetical protein [Cellvibrio sp. QJXJ]UUA75142.1 hypothetical protein NNX04_22050 [Cellvibrio sp. QJXJ]
MAVTNLHNAKLADGSPVKVADLKIGLVISSPSGMGGAFNYKCVRLTEDSALFKNLHKGWEEDELLCELKADDLTDEEYKQLDDAIKAFEGFNSFPSDEQRKLVHRAHKLGYVNQLSFTQVYRVRNRA